MKLSRVLLVTKRSAYETYEEDDRVGRTVLSRAKRSTVKALLASHNEHYKTLNFVEKVLDGLDLAVARIPRDESFDDNDYDLVLAVGGDGTFISASHHLRNVPVLGVNSAPRGSVGFFCSATRATVARDLEKIRRDTFPCLSLGRLQVDIGGLPVPVLALNDILYAHEQPAAMARYEIRIPGAREEQKSSGVWVAAPAGSGAAVGSAGGRKIPLDSKKFQFVVRELYRNKRHHDPIRKGILGAKDTLQIESHISPGKIFIDGQHVSYAVPFGSMLRFRLSPYPLRVFGLRAPVRRRVKKKPPSRR